MQGEIIADDDYDDDDDESEIIPVIPVVSRIAHMLDACQEFLHTYRVNYSVPTVNYIDTFVCIPPRYNCMKPPSSPVVVPYTVYLSYILIT